MSIKIAALFVENNGPYSNLDHVDVWSEDRDARKYNGPHPVVAHPPCQRWGKMYAGSPLWIKKTGQRKKKGDDDGCFLSALNSVRKFGGILEHPFGSHALPYFKINAPPINGGWIVADEFGGLICRVEQGRYGHYCPKPTILYAVNCNVPELEWGVYKVQDDDFPKWAMEKHGRKKCRRAGLMSFRGGGINSAQRIHTPDIFRDLLLEIVATAVDKPNH